MMRWLKTEWFIRTQFLYRTEQWYEVEPDGISCYTIRLNPMERLQRWLRLHPL